MDKRYEAFYVAHPQLVIPESFDMCLTYAEQVEYLAFHLHELEERVKVLEAKLPAPVPPETTT